LFPAVSCATNKLSSFYVSFVSSACRVGHRAGVASGVVVQEAQRSTSPEQCPSMPPRR
jgi:hypothetical protein